jgi:hypothetical protein
MQIILEIPEILGEQLQQLADRLPEALDRALQELTPPETIAKSSNYSIAINPALSPNRKQSNSIDTCC